MENTIRNVDYEPKPVKYRNNAATKEHIYMYGSWVKDEFWDVIIKCDQGKVHGHKVTLAAHSPALKEKFSEFGPAEIVTLDLSDIPRETVHSVIRYIYTDIINMSRATVMSIVFCALEIDILSLYTDSMDYIWSKINLVNAIYYYKEAIRWNVKKVELGLLEYIILNFKTNTDNGEIGIIPTDIFTILVKSDSLGITDEIDVLKGIISWVEKEKLERTKIAPTLLKYVRYQLIGVDSFVDLTEKTDLFRKTLECQAWLCDVLRYHALQGIQSNKLDSYLSQENRNRMIE